MSGEPPSQRARVLRKPARGAYDRDTIDAILDEALVAHLGFVLDGQPYVTPTLHARVGDHVYFHGSQASRTLRALSAGAPVCLTASILDGLVLARSAQHHSVNYRSVVVLGTARQIVDRDEHLAALEAFTERILPGRWREVRPPTAKEQKAVAVLSLALDEASAKVRRGPPLDDEEDYELDVWAGVIPLRMGSCAPQPDPRLSADVTPSAAVEHLLSERSRFSSAT